MKHVAISGSGGVMIANVSEPSRPKVAGKIRLGKSPKIHVSGNILYAVDDKRELIAIDVSNPANPETIGKIGLTEDIASQDECFSENIHVSGKFAYVTICEHLIVVDISDPENMRVAGKIKIGNARDIYVSGNYAYIAKFDDNLIVDVSDPSNPKVVSGMFWIDLRGVRVIQNSGKKYVIGNGKYGLFMIDVSDPRSPEIVSRLMIEGGVEEIHLAENRVYVLTKDEKLVAVDISNPGSPKELGSFDIKNTKVLSVRNNYMYSVVSSDDGTKRFVITDISDPLNPKILGDVNLGKGVKINLQVTEKYAYIVEGFGNRVLSVDISDPENPKILGQIEDNLRYSVVERDVYVSGNYIYIVNTVPESDKFSFLTIVDVSDPTDLKITKQMKIKWRGEKIYVSDNYAYVLDSKRGHLLVIDASDPENPKIENILDESWLYGGFVARSSKWLHDICVSDGYAYIAFGINGLKVVDVSDPKEPEIIGHLTFYKKATSVFVSTGFEYLLTDVDLTILDVSDPSNPRIVGSKDINGIVRDVQVEGNFAYVVSDVNLVVIDVSNPSEPKIVSETEVGESLNSVYVSNSYAYITGDMKLTVVDVSNPKEPKIVGYLPGGKIWDWILDGNIGYFHTKADIIIMENLNMVSWLNIKEDVKRMRVMNGHLYVAAVDKLIIFDVSNLRNPEFLGKVETTGVIREFYVSENYAYVFCRSEREVLIVVDVSNPKDPNIIEEMEISDLTGKWNMNGEDVDKVKVSASENYIYAGHGFYGEKFILSVIDISNPEKPEIIKQFKFKNEMRAIHTSKDRLYVLTDKELRIFDISKPSSIKTKGKLKIGYIYEAQISEDRIYVLGLGHTSNKKEFMIIDVSNPKTPEITNQMDFEDARDLCISGNYVYIAAEEDGRLKILSVDISDPKNIKILGQLDAWDVVDKYSVVTCQASNGHLYINSSHKDLTVIDITDPENLKLIDNIILMEFYETIGFESN